jgi:hypothetical protein
VQAGFLNVDHAVPGAEMSANILRELGYSEEKIECVKHRSISENKLTQK